MKMNTVAVTMPSNSGLVVLRILEASGVWTVHARRSLDYGWRALGEIGADLLPAAELNDRARRRVACPVLGFWARATS